MTHQTIADACRIAKEEVITVEATSCGDAPQKAMDAYAAKAEERIRAMTADDAAEAYKFLNYKGHLPTPEEILQNIGYKVPCDYDDISIYVTHRERT